MIFKSYWSIRQYLEYPDAELCREIDRQLTDDVQFSRRKRSTLIEDEDEADFPPFDVDKYHTYGEVCAFSVTQQ